MSAGSHRIRHIHLYRTTTTKKIVDALIIELWFKKFRLRYSPLYWKNNLFAYIFSNGIPKSMAIGSIRQSNPPVIKNTNLLASRKRFTNSLLKHVAIIKENENQNSVNWIIYNFVSEKLTWFLVTMCSGGPWGNHGFVFVLVEWYSNEDEVLLGMSLILSSLLWWDGRPLSLCRKIWPIHRYLPHEWRSNQHQSKPLVNAWWFQRLRCHFSFCLCHRWCWSWCENWLLYRC